MVLQSSSNPNSANFAFTQFYEVRLSVILRTRVNKAGKAYSLSRPDSRMVTLYCLSSNLRSFIVLDKLDSEC